MHSWTLACQKKLLMWTLFAPAVILELIGEYIIIDILILTVSTLIPYRVEVWRCLSTASIEVHHPNDNWKGSSGFVSLSSYVFYCGCEGWLKHGIYHRKSPSHKSCRDTLTVRILGTQLANNKADLRSCCKEQGGTDQKSAQPAVWKKGIAATLT